MSTPRDPLAWVAKADEDYHALTQVLPNTRPLTAIGCFHAQQTAEKYLKALLVAHGCPFPYTHDLDASHRLCAGIGGASLLADDDVDLLAAYAVGVRYPGPTPSRSEARRAFLAARRIRRRCRRPLGLG
jgi:HEPN domain-containing protein